MRNGIALVNRMAMGLCNVFPGLALALRSKPEGHFIFLIFSVKFLPMMKKSLFLRDGILWSAAAVLLLAAAGPPLQAQNYNSARGFETHYRELGYPFNRTHPGRQFSRGGSLEGDPGSAGARAPGAAWATPPGAAWWR